MIEKLKSRLAKSEGFTLIELLIVIAIIAILVVIVIVAINPAERLADAADSSAQSNVRQAGTLMSTCITKELSKATPATPAEVYSTTANVGCADKTAAGKLSEYGTVPPAAVSTAATASTAVCAYDRGGSHGATTNYYRWSSATGTVESATSAYSGC